jgi:hypothetical protein
MTECNQNEFAFAPHFSRQVSARFSERQLSTEGGALLLRETDQKIGSLSRATKCFSDHRHPVWIVHELSELLAQRIYGLALGYADLNDHEELRRDPLLAVLAGKRKLEEPLAGKSTLNRLELTPAGSPLNDRYHKITYSTEALDALLVDIFLEAHAKAPRQIVLDLDVTDTPLKSSRLVDVRVGLDGRPSECRGGAGRARIAWVRAMEAERTAEIRLEASKMPQRASSLHVWQKRQPPSHQPYRRRRSPQESRCPRGASPQDILVCRPGTPTVAGASRCEPHRKICPDGRALLPY